MIANREALGQDYTDEQSTEVAELVRSWSPASEQATGYTPRLGEALSERVAQANQEGEDEFTIVKWLTEHPKVLILVMAAAGTLSIAIPEVLQRIQQQ